MRRAYLIGIWMLAAGCGGSVSNLFPPPWIPARPTAADWPDAGAAVLDDQRTLSFELVRARGETHVAAVLERRRRLKILSAAGLEQARVSLRADGFSEITRIDARSVSPGGSTMPMSSGSVRRVPLPGARGAHEVYDAVFEVPGAQVGGLVEYRYRQVFDDPAFLPTLVLGGSLPVTRAELSVITHPGIGVDFRYGRGERVVEREPLRRRSEDGRERLVFVERDLPAYYSEPDAPHLARRAPWVVVVVNDIRIGKLRRSMKTWAEVGDLIRPLLARVGAEPRFLTPEQSFRAVRDVLRPLALPGLGVRRPVSAAELRAGAPACTRDAAALLYETLQRSGAVSYPAFVTSLAGPPAVPDLPGLYPFVRAVVAVELGDRPPHDGDRLPHDGREDLARGAPSGSSRPGSYVFLDPSCSGCRYGELPTSLTGGRALVMLDEPRWVDIPEDPPERNRLSLHVSAALDVEGSISGTLTGEASGAHARRLRRVLSEHDLDEARNEAVIEAVAGDRTALSLDEGIFANEHYVDAPLRLRGRVTASAQRADYDHLLLRPRDLVGFSLPGHRRARRRCPALLDAPAVIEAVAAVDLPPGFEAELPPAVELTEAFAAYTAGFALRDGTLTFTRRLVIEQHVIPAEQWEAMSSFLAEVARAESRAIVLTRADGPP